MPDKNSRIAVLDEHDGRTLTPHEEESDSTEFSADWRKPLASGLYRTGMLRAARTLSRTYELYFSEGSRVPKWRRVTTPKFLILCYHRVGTGGVPIYSELSPRLFEAQMRFLRKHYRIVSLADVCKGLQAPSTIGPAVAITFDDGYRDVYTYAFPTLQKYAIPATVFLIADAVETGQAGWYDRVFVAMQVAPEGEFAVQLAQLKIFHLISRQSRLHAAFETMSYLRSLPNADRTRFCAELEKRIAVPRQELENRMMTWSQARTMQNAGISFGSHTVTHPVVSRLNSSELEFEITESKKILETRLGRPVEDFAYPFGQPKDCGDMAAEQLGRSGYRSAVTTVTGINKPGADLFGLRRVQVGPEHSLSLFSLFLNQAFLYADSLERRPTIAENALSLGAARAKSSSIKRDGYA